MSKVYVYVQYHLYPDTGEQDLQITEVYANYEDAKERFNDVTLEIEEEIPGNEPILRLDDEKDYFHLATEWRIETVFIKEVEIK